MPLGSDDGGYTTGEERRRRYRRRQKPWLRFWLWLREEVI